jgi:hypothetical protein
MKRGILPGNDLLAATRERFAQERRSWLFGWRPYHRLARPLWAKGRDTPFECIYQDYRRLLKKGAVGWAHIVQANAILLKPGADDCPAAVVFSLDPFFDDKLKALAELAGLLFGLKDGEVRDPDLAELADAITDEEQVLFNRTLPRSLTFRRRAYYTTIMVHRKHLPVRLLKASWFPLVADPDETPASVILPSRYWDPELVEMWRASRRRRRS